MIILKLNSFDPFHFLNETSNLMANIIKDELKKCEPLQDDKRNNLPYTLERTIEGEKMQEKNYKTCQTAEMRTVLSPSGAYVCPYHRGNKICKLEIRILRHSRKFGMGKQEKKLWKNLILENTVSFIVRHETNKLLDEVASGKKIDKVPDYDRFM